MSPLNHKRTTSSLAPPIFYVAKKWHLKDRGLPIDLASPLYEESKTQNFAKFAFEMVTPTSNVFVNELNLSKIGLHVCFADIRQIDTPTDKWNKGDKNLYIYCTCKKSTISRAPGV